MSSRNKCGLKLRWRQIDALLQHSVKKPVEPPGVGTLRGLDVLDFQSAKSSDTRRFNRFFHAMLEQGIYLPPSQFEAAFISAAHTAADIDRTIEAATKALGS